MYIRNLHRILNNIRSFLNLVHSRHHHHRLFLSYFAAFWRFAQDAPKNLLLLRCALPRLIRRLTNRLKHRPSSGCDCSKPR